METKQLMNRLVIAYQSAVTNLSENQKKMLPLIAILAFSGIVYGGYGLVRYLTVETVSVDVLYSDNAYALSLWGNEAMSVAFAGTGDLSVSFIEDDPSSAGSADTAYVNLFVSADEPTGGGWALNEAIFFHISTFAPLMVGEGTLVVEYKTVTDTWVTADSTLNVREDANPREIRYQLTGIDEPSDGQPTTFTFDLQFEGLDTVGTINAADLPTVILQDGSMNDRSTPDNEMYVQYTVNGAGLTARKLRFEITIKGFADVDLFHGAFTDTTIFSITGHESEDASGSPVFTADKLASTASEGDLFSHTVDMDQAEMFNSIKIMIDGFVRLSPGGGDLILDNYIDKAVITIIDIA